MNNFVTVYINNFVTSLYYQLSRNDKISMNNTLKILICYTILSIKKSVSLNLLIKAMFLSRKLFLFGGRKILGTHLGILSFHISEFRNNSWKYLGAISRPGGWSAHTVGSTVTHCLYGQNQKNI